MKKLFLSVFLSVVAGALTISAQLPSLPIGSTNVVLEDAVRQVNGFSMDVRLLSKDELSVEEFLADEYSPSTSPLVGETTEVVRKRLADLIGSVNFNKPEYAGRAFLTTYGGWRYLPDRETATNVYLIWGTDNRFLLEKNEKGDFVAPQSAYTVDLVAAVMRSHSRPFFVTGIVRAKLETMNEYGDTIVLEGDGGYNPEGLTVYPEQGYAKKEVVYLPARLVTSGQEGKVTLWYKSGAQQVFSLADGHLVPSLTLRKAGSGVELLVSSLDAFTIEVSENLREWSVLYLPPAIEPAAPVLVQRFSDPVSVGKRFYRLRVGGTPSPNRR